MNKRCLAIVGIMIIAVAFIVPSAMAKEQPVQLSLLAPIQLHPETVPVREFD